MPSRLRICGTGLAAVALLLCCNSASAQRIAWEVLVDHSSGLESMTLSGVDISVVPSSDTLFVSALGSINSPFGSLITCISANGDVLWSHEVRESEASLYPSSSGPDLPVSVLPRFIEERDDGILVFHGQSRRAAASLGQMYFLHLTREGVPLDTIGGERDGTAAPSMLGQWVRGRDEAIVVFDYKIFFDSSLGGHPLGLYRCTSNGTYRPQEGSFRRHQLIEPHPDIRAARFPADAIRTSDGYLVWGTLSSDLSDSTYPPQPFLLKVDDSLDFVWGRVGDVPVADGTGIAAAIDTLPSGGTAAVYAANHLNPNGAVDSIEAVVVVRDEDGHRRWHRTISGRGEWWRPTSICVAANGDIAVGGFYLTDSGEKRDPSDDEDMFLARFDVDGTRIALHTWGAPDMSDRIEAIRSGPDGDLYVTGTFSGDLYIARLRPEPTSVQASPESRSVQLDLSVRDR